MEMNDSSLLFQAQFLHDSVIFRLLIFIKLFLATISVFLLWKIRHYEAKVLVHDSLSILMRFHFYYIFLMSTSCSLDYSITLYQYISGNVNDYVISSSEHFVRRFPQILGAYGAFSSMYMMAVERYTASKNFRTYEGTNKNTVYFWVHIAYVASVMPFAVLAYDFGSRYAVSTAVPEGGLIYHQIISAPQILFETVTSYLFEYLFRLNKNRLQNTSYSLTERYQIAENVRMLEILRPLARFHGMITTIGIIGFVMFGQNLLNGPSYPIFEESLNFVQLQGILLPLIFLRHERKERVKIAVQLNKNRTTSDEFVSIHNTEITKGW